MVDLTFLTAKWEMPGAGVCNFHYLIKKAYLSRDINIFLSGRNLSLWCGHCQTFSSIMVNVCNHDFVNDQKCYLNGLLILTLCGSQVHNVLSYLSGLMNRFLLINPFKNHFKHFFFFFPEMFTEYLVSARQWGSCQRDALPSWSLQNNGGERQFDHI